MTPKQQLAQTRRELEQARKLETKRRIREMRAALRAAKVSKRERIQQIRKLCAGARVALRERSKRLRRELAESLRAESRARVTKCGAARARATKSGAERIADAERSLRAALSARKHEAVWTGATASRPGLARARASERQHESDDEVERDIPDELRPVWQRVKHKIRGTARRSRTEAFVEWAAEHQGEVYAILEEQTERDVRTLEREYRTARRKTGGRSSLAAVPF